MFLGLSSATYGGTLPDQNPLSWLLDRCSEYGFRALEASLPEAEAPAELRRKASDIGVTWVGYWADDFVTPPGGPGGLRERAERAFDAAVMCGIQTLVIMGAGRLHNRFTREPPLPDQLRLMAEHLGPAAEVASERSLHLGLLPHLDYRGCDLLSVMEEVDQPALRMAFDTANPFPVCEEPVEAARVVLPFAVAVAFKDVRIYPHRSNDVTIWGTPIGQGSVDFGAIVPMLSQKLPDPAKATVCIKLRLPPGSREHDAWMRQSLDFLRVFPELHAMRDLV